MVTDRLRLVVDGWGEAASHHTVSRRTARAKFWRRDAAVTQRLRNCVRNGKNAALIAKTGAQRQHRRRLVGVRKLLRECHQRALACATPAIDRLRRITDRGE